MRLVFAEAAPSELVEPPFQSGAPVVRPIDGARECHETLAEAPAALAGAKLFLRVPQPQIDRAEFPRELAQWPRDFDRPASHRSRARKLAIDTRARGPRQPAQLQLQDRNSIDELADGNVDGYPHPFNLLARAKLATTFTRAKPAVAAAASRVDGRTYRTFRCLERGECRRLCDRTFGQTKRASSRGSCIIAPPPIADDHPLRPLASRP